MIKKLICLSLLLLNLSAFAQFTPTAPYQKATEPFYKTAISVGLLHGGGSLLGVDLETMLGKRVGAQIGFGLIGFGGGINIHLADGAKSSMFSIQYFNQGVGDGMTQNGIATAFVYRAKSKFTASFGLASPLSQGPAWPEGTEQPDVQLFYAIGIYFVKP
ncbi:MAG: hypothetical protein ACPF8V_02140 [Luteibaculum sp.]